MKSTSSAIFSKDLDQGKFEIDTSQPTQLDLIHVHQTHSKKISRFDKGVSEFQLENSDGIISLYPELNKKSLAIKTADCLPVIYLGKKGAALVHAGWRGVENGILTHDLINEIEPYYAFIGPSIHQESFEVQEDFRLNFPKSEFFVKVDGKLTFDLQKEAIFRITSKFKIQVEDSGICTFEDKRFHSFRRNGTSERNWNIFSL